MSMMSKAIQSNLKIGSIRINILISKHLIGLKESPVLNLRVLLAMESKLRIIGIQCRWEWRGRVLSSSSTATAAATNTTHTSPKCLQGMAMNSVEWIKGALDKVRGSEVGLRVWIVRLKIS